MTPAPASSSSRPTVSAVVLTCPGREHFLRAFRARLERFSHKPDELLYLDGPQGVGIKRQMGLEQAAGDVIVMLDDDDWHHPDRLRKQVATLAAHPGSLVGTNRFFVHDTRTGETKYSRTWGGADCMPAGSMAFWRAPALAIGFSEPGHCAELPFQRAWQGPVIDMKDPSLYVHFRHGGNLTPDDWALSPSSKPVPDSILRSYLGPQWALR